MENILLETVEKVTSFIAEIEEGVMNSSDLSKITSRQMSYIDTLKKNSSISLSKLAEILEISKPTASVAVNKLISNGYVMKDTSAEDRRRVILKLTEKGLEITKKHDRAHHIICDEIKDRLSEEETNQLIRLISKVLIKT